MNTKDFIKSLAERLHVSQKEADRLLEQTSRVIRETVAEEQKLTVLHLGSFQVKRSASRSAYIPALDKKALMPPKNSIHFQPADTLKDKLKNYSRP
jgi:nucleoid DNA-binding protein